jgi:hypothetical protein
MTGRARHRRRPAFGLRILFFVAGFLLAGGTAAMAFYVIKVVDNGSPATSQAALLTAPTAPTASANDTSGTITIAWSAGSQPPDAPVQYQVERSSGPGSPATVCTVGSSTTSCQDTGLVAGTTYGYTITAVLDSWQSTFVTASATTATPTLSLTLSTTSTTAGQPVSVQTIAAMVGGTIDPTYTGSKTINWSGLSDGPSGQNPSYPSASVSFSNGVATLTGPGSSFTDFEAGSTMLTATDADAATVTGQAALTVNPAAATSFVLPTPSTQSAGNAFDETLTAVDAYGNTASGFGGAQEVTFDGPSASPSGTAPSYPDSVTFTDGVGSAPITLFDAGTTTLAAAQGTITGSSGTFIVSAAGADSFVLPTPSTQSAGTGFDETITAVDAYGNTASGWALSTRCVTITGPAASPDASAPIYPAAGTCPVGESSLTFDASGTGTASITLFDAGTTVLTATQGAITGTSGTFTVNPLAASSFVLSTPSPLSAGTPFDVTITATDIYGNTSTGYTGPQVLTFTGPSDSPDGIDPVYPASVLFTAGAGTASITLSEAETTTLTATAGLLTGTSGSFTVVAAGAGPQDTEASVLLRSPAGRDPAARLALTHLWLVPGGIAVLGPGSGHMHG